jgi:transposase InsO family protein
MTYLPTQVQGQWFYLYLTLDLYSRMIIGWEIHASDNADILTRSSRVAKCSQIIFIYAASTIAAIGHTA